MFEMTAIYSTKDDIYKQLFLDQNLRRHILILCIYIVYVTGLNNVTMAYSVCYFHSFSRQGFAQYYFVVCAFYLLWLQCERRQ